MIRNNFFPILFLLVLSAAFVFSQLIFVPAWENLQTPTFFILCALSFLLSAVTLILAIKNRKIEKKQAWIKSFIVIFIFVPALIFVFLYGVLSLGHYPFAPVFEKSTEVNGCLFYQYQQTCAPPDNMCECDERLTIIYQKRRFFPLMKYRCGINMYVSDIKFKNDSLYFIPAKYCDSDTIKTLQIPFDE